MTRDLIVSEVFGPTVQGEGPTTGQRCAFVRLGRCNLDCGWCDTPYTWDWTGKNGTAYDPADLTRRTVDSVVDELQALDVNRVVVSGGEPLLQRTALTTLTHHLVKLGYAVEIETNGTMPPLDVEGVTYNVSPKLAHAGVTTRDPINLDALAALHRCGAIYKFVAATDTDLDEIADVVQRAGIEPDRVWVMPLGTSPHEVKFRSRALADAVIAKGWNLTGRLHVTLWGNTRGR